MSDNRPVCYANERLFIVIDDLVTHALYTQCSIFLSLFCFLLFSDDLQNRDHCWNTASLCDKNRTEGQQRKDNNSLGGSGIGILRRVHRCLSSGAIPIPASMTIASSSSTLHPDTEPTFYQSYSCDDLYLVSDLLPCRSSATRVVASVDSISEQQESERPDSDEQPYDDLVLQEIDLTNPAEVVCTVCS